ncbi:hypothetical protein [uncultured Lentibacter sp.]|jgi:hypothetical protein|uniref:hypothetical protein n=1 Tax=uncultured Lentibacter sp. TaxID=1659309 RepID=UPI00262A97CF|nr:hypothetical protein [uncultured Lentibacter sp.]
MFIIKPKSTWYPKHYDDLNNVCIAVPNGSESKLNALGVTTDTSQKRYVRHLSSAASKYRLAKYCEGFRDALPDFDGDTEPSQELINGYSAQLIVMLAFVALESHLRMRDTSWQDFDFSSHQTHTVKLAELARKSLSDEALCALQRAMDNANLRRRLQRFREGDNNEALAVMSAVRNAFAHGKMGVKFSVDLSSAKAIRDALLDLIVADCEQMIAFLSEE